MKLNSVLVFSIALAVTTARADVLTLDAGLENKNTMTWPMLPGESLNALAAKFYPNNKVMQRHFVLKTQGLNAASMPNLNAEANFSVPTALVIPTLKSLAAGAVANKAAQQAPSNTRLQLSQNIASAIARVPKSLLVEYENLVTRNNFLKEELAKLNEKLVFLQSKLKELKLILDKNVSLPPQKKVFKNLDIHLVKPNLAKPDEKPAESPSNHFDINLLLSILGIGLSLAAALGAYSYHKNRQQRAKKSIEELRPVPALVDDWDVTVIESESSKQGQPLGADTQVKDLNAHSILEEAKYLMSKSQPTEAIEHIKWSIRANVKVSPKVWMYLLKIFKQENLREDFENYAKMMHQTFNIMTPTWEETSVAMVVARSLEEFPHIVDTLTSLWPGELASEYLFHLMNDNRNGERIGFSQEVVEEMLLLSGVLEHYGDSA